MRHYPVDIKQWVCLGEFFLTEKKIITIEGAENMGFFDKLLGKATNQEQRKEEGLFVAEDLCIYAPLDGEIIPLSEIADGVFSEGILGKGCGVRPTDGTVVAPFDGEVIQVAETKHAIGMISGDGAEVLIHVGMDTVEMKGRGFCPLVKVGDKVKCGQKILTFSISDVVEAGYPTTTAIVVTNTDEFAEVELLSLGLKTKLDKIIKLSK